MSITVTVNGKIYSLDEAEKMGLLPKKIQPVVHKEDNNVDELELIIDEETKSFRLQVNNKEPVDIPKSILIDIFEVSEFKSISNIIEEDGVDDDTLKEIAYLIEKERKKHE